jgi:hypothetical protein
MLDHRGQIWRSLRSSFVDEVLDLSRVALHEVVSLTVSARCSGESPGLRHERSKEIHPLVNDAQHVHRISINSIHDDVAKDRVTSQRGQEVIPSLAEIGICSEIFKGIVDRFFVVGSLSDIPLRSCVSSDCPKIVGRSPGDGESGLGADIRIKWYVLPVHLVGFIA